MKRQRRCKTSHKGADCMVFLEMGMEACVPYMMKLMCGPANPTSWMKALRERTLNSLAFTSSAWNDVEWIKMQSEYSQSWENKRDTGQKLPILPIQSGYYR